jgi:hypothetical protein
LGLRKWTLVDSDVSGCYRLKDGECLSSRPAIDDVANMSTLTSKAVPGMFVEVAGGGRRQPRGHSVERQQPEGLQRPLGQCRFRGPAIALRRHRRRWGMPEGGESSSAHDRPRCPPWKRRRTAQSPAQVAPREQPREQPWFDLFCGARLSSPDAVGGGSASAAMATSIGSRAPGSSGLERDSSGSAVQPISVQPVSGDRLRVADSGEGHW